MERKPLTKACKQREIVQGVSFDRTAVRGELEYPFAGIQLPQRGFQETSSVQVIPTTLESHLQGLCPQSEQRGFGGRSPSVELELYSLPLLLSGMKGNLLCMETQ